MSRVDVSVIMPCFNGAGHLARSVSSALAQTHADLELIFIDDGSTDGSATVASKFDDSRMQVHSQANAGVSAARNRGLALARGKYIAFLDADDTWDPAFVGKMVAALESRQEAALAYCGWQNVGLSGGRGAPFVPPDYEVAEKRARLVERCRWPIHAAVTRAAAIKTAGGFDERLAVGEDFLLWMEIGCFNPIIRVPEVLAYYHHHEGAQATDNKIRAALHPYDAQRTFLSRHPDVASHFGAARARDLTLAPLLAKGYSSYWSGDLDPARAIFRQVMKRGYGRVQDWKYMLPALLPRSIHRAALDLLNDAPRADGTSDRLLRTDTDNASARMSRPEPRLVVFTTLFPHAGRPGAGLFIRERMFRVAKVLPLTVVAPVPWFPLQGLLRRWKPGFRPVAPVIEVQDGIEVRHPRFFSVPGAFKWLDGLFMALACLPTMRGLKRSFAFNVIDAHFAYPDGYAATLLGRWLRVPVTVTLRGTVVPLARDPPRRRRLIKALKYARRIFSVSESLKQHVVSLGVARDKIMVVGNGIDTAVFHRVERAAARHALNLPADAPVLISVGALVERKGFHRVMECLPALRRHFPGLRYLVVGGASPEGDWTGVLRERAKALGLEDCVVFLGALAPRELKLPLSAADVFVLATQNEGWANVFLEAMACGLPVVTTSVGGNSEVVAHPGLGILVPFGEPNELERAMTEALRRDWDRASLVAHAEANGWDKRVAVLADEFAAIVAGEVGVDLPGRAIHCV